MIQEFDRPADLPRRDGPPPRIHPGPPQHQLDQMPDPGEWARMREIIATWGQVDTAPSRRAVAGTLGLILPEGASRAASDDCFLLGSEFAHHHPKSDGGLHLVLPPDWHEAAIEHGWAVPHTWAGRPTVSRWTVLVFAPRSTDELAVARQLVAEAERFARGNPSTYL